MSNSQTAVVRGVLVASDARSLVSAAQPEVEVTFEGFRGDQHSGLTRRADGRTPFYPRGATIRNLRQVSLVSLEELAQIAAALGLPELRPDWLGANLLLEGIPALSLLPGLTRLFFEGGAVLVVMEENLPCSGPGKVLQALFPEIARLAAQFPRAALHKRGLVAVVEHPGMIRAGDGVRVQSSS